MGNQRIEILVDRKSDIKPGRVVRLGNGHITRCTGVLDTRRNGVIYSFRSVDRQGHHVIIMSRHMKIRNGQVIDTSGTYDIKPQTHANHRSPKYHRGTGGLNG